MVGGNFIYPYSYNIRIGNEYNGTPEVFELYQIYKSIEYNELVNTWGCPYLKENCKKDISWEVVLIVHCGNKDNEDDQEYFTKNGDQLDNWRAYIDINEIYSGEDYEEAASDDFIVETTEDTGEINLEETYDEFLRAKALNEEEESDNSISWIKKFLTNPKGTFINTVLDVIKAIADAVQMLINLVQTLPLGVYDDWTLEYTDQQLVSDGSDGARNQYTKVSNVYNEDDDSKISSEFTSNEGDYKLSVYIDDSDPDNYIFESVKIPIIYVDFYTIATNKVGALDINFLEVDSSHSEDSVWMSIRNIVASIVLVSFYVSALILIMALILQGVKIAGNSINPYKRAKDKEGLNNLIVGVIMLVGTILIMALSIYSYQAILGDVYDEDSYELPIRVYVYQSWGEKAGFDYSYNEIYSFSTSFTGYIRFMAQIENPDRCMEKAGYVVAYVILVVMNVIVLIIMFIRTIAMWVLSIVGPILAAIYALIPSKKVMNWYKSWAFVYLMFALIQVIFAIICVVLLNIMEF